MSVYIFNNPNEKPNDKTLKEAVGEYFAFYNELIKLTNQFKSEWHYYKSGGWILKIFQSKKALCYFIPLDNCCRVNLTIRQNEKDEILLNGDMKFIHKILEDSKKFPEGYAIYFEINDSETSSDCKKFISEIIKFRLK